ncbi:hypothetical protein BX600DRAFT_511517 [Xylariales sp. PMI_506]|nr:hypothetical protein BX600DRAFT_511517 [Xylariales sp. PMI_506]
MTAKLITAAMALVNCLPSAAAPLQVYGLVPMTWAGPAQPGEPNVTLTGSVEEISQKIHSIDATSKDEQDFDQVAFAPSKRSKNGITCGVGGSGSVDLDYLNQGIAYLAGRPGLCIVNGGSGQCSRVSCAYNTAIWMCNNESSEQKLPCAEVATYVEDIRSECLMGNLKFLRVRGMETDSNGFYISVGADSC